MFNILNKLFNRRPKNTAKPVTWVVRIKLPTRNIVTSSECCIYLKNTAARCNRAFNCNDENACPFRTDKIFA